MNSRALFFVMLGLFVVVVSGAVGFRVYKASQITRNEKSGLLHSEDYEPPPEVKEEGPQPKAVAEETLYNFGRMSKNQTQTHSFGIKNEGESTLILTVGDSSCKCTLGNISDKELEPGESSTVDLEWTPTKPTNSFRQYATIHTNDPNNKELLFAVEGQIFETFEISPDEVWKTGSMTPGETRTIKGRLTSRTVEEFDLGEITSTSEYITATSTPLPKEELEESELTSGHEIAVTVSPGFKFGAFKGDVKLESEYDGGVMFNIHVEGFIKGPFTFLKANKLKGVTWNAPSMMLNLGRFSSGKGRDVKMRVYISDLDRVPDEEVFQIHAIESDIRYLEVEHEIIEIDEESRRATVDMVFKYKEGSPPITKSAEQSAIVRVKTNHPDAPDFPIFVAFAAE